MFAGLAGIVIKALFGSIFGAIAGWLAQQQMKKAAADQQSAKDAAATTASIVSRYSTREAIDQKVRTDAPVTISNPNTTSASTVPSINTSRATGLPTPDLFTQPDGTIVSDKLRESWTRD